MVQKATIRAGEITEVSIDLQRVWNPSDNGWYSGDNHFHLNYGGPYNHSPRDLIPMMLGEDLDVATPLIANLHNRFGDQDLFGWESDTGPIIQFGQEIRSHFLGHMGLINTSELHWPWVWGPGYQVYGQEDRTNGSVLDFAHEQEGFGWYVHPFAQEDPLTPAGMAP